MHLNERIKLPVERNRSTREVAICLPNWLKWAGGFFATFVTTGIIAMVSLQWHTSLQVGVNAVTATSVKERLETIEEKVEKVREDPFTGTQASDMRKEIINRVDGIDERQRRIERKVGT